VSVTVHIPQQLRNYTGGKPSVVAKGGSVDDVMSDLDGRYPGIRFRVIDEQGHIRMHMRIFVDGVRSQRISERISSGSEIHILGALSGG
jgi:molybdopterin converting factor small subunit